MEILEPRADGGYEAAGRFAREMATWSPSRASPDVDIDRAKDGADARSRDMVQNEGYALSAVSVNKDSIVGGQYVLNSSPAAKVLGADDTWAEEFQEVVETRFGLWAESMDNWPDASRRNTFTGLVRLAVGMHAINGEVLATGEWLRSSAQRRPNYTAIQMVNLDRLSNPNGQSDSQYLRRGIEIDPWGAHTAFHIRNGHPHDWYNTNAFTWTRVPIRKPWGRLQVLYLSEQMFPQQTRAVSDMVTVLKEMRMTKKFREITLQNAVIQATYAASIESELPPEVVWEQLGGGQSSALSNYLGQLGEFASNAKGLAIDGVKIPHLFPGTKMKLQPAATVGGIGTEFEDSLLRYLAAGLGISYEELSKDFSKTNYSSARASMVQSWKTAQARKMLIADRFASMIYGLWLEEEINGGNVPLPAGKNASHFYEGLNREAYSACEWIGAARGQIDELKETQAAELRVNVNMSTLEAEAARTGKDWRKVLRQRARERKFMNELGMDPDANNKAVQAAKIAEQKANDKSDSKTKNDKSKDDDL